MLTQQFYSISENLHNLQTNETIPANLNTKAYADFLLTKQ